MKTNENGNYKIKILVVEDSLTQAEQVRYELEKKGYELHVCYNGQEAYEWLKSAKELPDVIISDVVMPKMDGYELCKAIRKDKELSTLPIVLLTSLSEPQDIIKSIEAGANKFLTKPFNPKRLTEVINELYINTQRRSVERMEMGIRLVFGGKDFLITADKVQILDLLLSSYEESYYQNLALKQARSELEALNAELETRVIERTLQLKSSEEQYRTLSENTPDLIIRFDREKKIVFANTAFETLLNIKVSEIVGKPVTYLETLTKSCACDEILTKVFKNKKLYTQEYLCLKNGEEIWIDATYVPEFDQEEQIQSVLQVSRDITQRKQLEQKVQEKEQLMLIQSKHAAMGEMIGMIAHQWRQPLTVIAMGANNIIADVSLGLGTDVSYKQQAEDIVKQTDYLSSTIEDFRNFFRPNKHKEMCNIASVMDESLQIIGKSLEHNLISVRKNYAPTHDIFTYSRELMQVFYQPP